MNEELIDLNLLRVLKAIETEGSVTAAAQRLGLSQPAISNALGRMRRALGDPVFVRSTAGMRATLRGRRLLASFDTAMGLIRQGLQDDSSFDPATSTVRMTLLITEMGELALLPALMQALAVRAPAMNLVVQQLSRTEHAATLEAGLADVAVGHIAAPRPTLRTRRLFQDRFVCMMRAGHPMAHETLTMERYLALSHIAVSRHGREQIIPKALGASRDQRRIALTVPHFTAAPMLVLHSDLVVTVPRRLVDIFEPIGITAGELPFSVPKLTLSLYWHEQQTTNLANRWMRSLFVELFGSERRLPEARAEA